MLVIPNIVTYQDVRRLSKSILQEICINLSLTNEGSQSELAEKVWIKVRGDQQLQKDAFESYKDHVLAGKTSVSWFEFINSSNISGLKEHIIEESIGNPFNNVLNFAPEDIDSSPLLISAANGDEEGEYYLRYVFKSGTYSDFDGVDLTVRSRTSLATVYVNEKKGILEVRSNPSHANKIAVNLARLLKQQISLTHKDILAPFGHNTERMADALGGKLIDATGVPQLLLEELTEAQAEALVSVLSAIDQFLKDDGNEQLEECLRSARETFGEELLNLPFVAIVLSGMSRVGLGVDGRDLRGTPLYDILAPHLQHQGGYIHFDVEEDNLKQSYTIQVGTKSNSIYFATPATENVIKKIRESIIIQ
ncbi:hypothetical protein P4797_20695 [Priestia aryabhattai]|uniref:hypothetical protein n=1 Tax=Priestia aryabhattai TaxID=412384 RepID=UPI002E20C46E|nr:hypothetical protein [Priestia aryabhattai]